MSPTFRSLLLAGLASVLLAMAGCAMGAEDTPLIPGDTPPDATRCAVDQDCPDPGLFFCNTATALCEPACRSREDCAKARRDRFALPECDESPLGCQCDMNRCLPGVCADDAACGTGKVCRDGGCVAADAVASARAESCEVTPDVATGRAGVAVAFQVWVRDEEGRPLVVRDGVTWEARSAAVVARAASTGPRATFVLAAPGLEAEAVRVRVGDATCVARVSVLPADVPQGGVRVQAVDELTGRPVALATVAVSDAAGSVTAEGVTDARGAVWVPATGEVGLSVFHEAYGYLTLARHDASGARDVRLALRRNPAELSGGVRGTFAPTRAQGSDTTSLRMALTGLSVPGLISEVGPGGLLGPERELELGAGGGAQRVSLPSGAALWLPGAATPGDITAPGVAGVCDETLTGDDEAAERAVREGRCGTRTAWALTGLLPPAELPLNALGPGTDPLLVLGSLVPRSPRTYSSLARDTQFTLAPTADYSQSVSHVLEGVRLAFPFAVRVPELPTVGGEYLARAWAVGAVAVPGRGLVPLGLGAAANVAPADPNTDAAGRGEPGVLPLRMAPAHHGLEGLPYRLMVAASSRAPGDGASFGKASSTLVVDLAGPDFDPAGARPVVMGMGFLRIPEDARYNFDASAYGGLEGRQFRAGVDERASLVRVVFTNREGRRWTVLAEPAQAREGLRVPRPPAGFADRTYFGDVQGSRARLRVEVLTVRSRETREPLGPTRLTAADGPGLEAVADLLRAESSLDAGRPEVAWLFPELEGQRLVRGSAVRVRVSGFTVGSTASADGFVRVTLRGGSGCEGQVLRGDTDVAQGRGEVEVQLPPACTGTGVSLVAELADAQGVPLRPAVSAVRGVDIL